MRCLVIIPTYNEVLNLPGLIPRVLDALSDGEILVVDDGSPDGTGALADSFSQRDPRVHVLHRPSKAGLGRAYQAGMDWALQQGALRVAQMDGDGSHDPEALPRLLQAVDRGADVAIGSRYIPGGRVVDWPRHRLLLSVAANAYTRALTRLPVRDSTSGFKVWNAASLARSGVERIAASDYAFQVEHLYRAHCLGMVLREIPITFTERRLGRTNLSQRALWESALLPFRLPRRPR